MTDTTQEDVLAAVGGDYPALARGVEAYEENKRLLTAYKSLGSPEYLAALVEENRAEREKVKGLVEAAEYYRRFCITRCPETRRNQHGCVHGDVCAALDAMRRPENERLREEGL